MHAVGIHREHRLPLESVPVLGAEVKMQMMPVIAIGAVVDLVRMEGLVQCLRHVIHVIEKGGPFLVGQVHDFGNVMLRSNDNTTLMALLLEQHELRSRQFGDCNAEYV